MEKIKIEDFLTELKRVDEEFAEICEEYSTEYAIASSIMSADIMNKYFDWQKDESFLYELVVLNTEKGDGKDEETFTAIFLRKSDNKLFELWLHDSGFIDSDCLTLCSELVEVLNK